MKTPKFYVHKSYNQTSGGNYPDQLYGPFASEEDAKYKIIELDPDLELEAEEYDFIDYSYRIVSMDDFPAEDHHGDLIDEENQQYYDFELELSFGHAQSIHKRTILKIGTLNQPRTISLKIGKLSFDDLVEAQGTESWSNDEDQIKLVFGDLLDLDDLDEDEIADLATDIRVEASKYIFSKSELVHEAADLKFYKFANDRECSFFSVNADSEILDTTESPTKLFAQYDLELGYAAHKIVCSWDTFLIGYDGADELPDTTYEDRQSADLIRTAKKLNIPIIFTNPDLAEFEVCILFPVSPIMDFSDLDQEEQDSILADCDDDEDCDECMSVQYAKLSGSDRVIGLKDFMRCHPDNFWEFYYATSNTSVFLIKFWNHEICTLVHA